MKQFEEIGRFLFEEDPSFWNRPNRFDPLWDLFFKRIKQKVSDLL